MSNAKKILDEFAQLHSDRRTGLVDLKIDSEQNGSLFLKGRILEKHQLEDLIQRFNNGLPGTRIDTGGVVILRKAPARTLTVIVNLTSVHDEPSWLAEMLSQVTYGTCLEVLEEKEEWVFTRQEDGYLGWVYLPYLSEEPLPADTHLVSVPLTFTREKPGANAPTVTRLFAGTAVHIEKVQEGWACLAASNAKLLCPIPAGWIPLADLVEPGQIPQDPDLKREIIVRTALSLLGVPYLWGGCSAGGIDCSGLARLAHRLAGISISRDADMQKTAGKQVEKPLKPGDLVFFTGENDPTHTRITHVGISMGGDRIIHSSRMNNGVYINEMQTVPHLRNDYAGAVTYLSS